MGVVYNVWEKSVEPHNFFTNSKLCLFYRCYVTIFEASDSMSQVTLVVSSKDFVTTKKSLVIE